MMSQSRGLWQYVSQSKGRTHTKAKRQLQEKRSPSERKKNKKNKCCHFNDSARPEAARSHLDQSNEACLKIDLLPKLT